MKKKHIQLGLKKLCGKFDKKKRNMGVKSHHTFFDVIQHYLLELVKVILTIFCRYDILSEIF